MLLNLFNLSTICCMHSSFVIFCYPLVSHIISQTSAYVKNICSVKIVLKLYFVDAKLLRYVKQIFKIITYILGIWEFAEPYPQYQNLKSFSKGCFYFTHLWKWGKCYGKRIIEKIINEFVCRQTQLHEKF